MGNVPTSTEKLTSPNGVTATSYFTFESADVHKSTKFNENGKSAQQQQQQHPSHNIIVVGEIHNANTIVNFSQNK